MLVTLITSVQKQNVEFHSAGMNPSLRFVYQRQDYIHKHESHKAQYIEVTVLIVKGVVWWFKYTECCQSGDVPKGPWRQEKRDTSGNDDFL